MAALPRHPIPDVSQTEMITFDFQSEGWDVENCTDKRIQELAVGYFEALCHDANLRSEMAQKSVAVLETGFWYANEYMQLLKKHKSMKRHDWLKKKGAFYHGFCPKNFKQPKVKNNKIDFQVQMTNRQIGHYVSKPNILASVALDELLPGKNTRFYFTDCQMAVEIAYYCALRCIFGKNRFNNYFHAENPLILDTNRRNTPLYALLEQRVDCISPAIW